jgi:hypothetical protein
MTSNIASQKRTQNMVIQTKEKPFAQMTWFLNLLGEPLLPAFFHQLQKPFSTADLQSLSPIVLLLSHYCLMKNNNELCQSSETFHPFPPPVWTVCPQCTVLMNLLKFSLRCLIETNGLYRYEYSNTRKIRMARIDIPKSKFEEHWCY